ncbi:MAG: HEAT repeat domain-containing protein [Planctomycetes bacterium]|nr:HEAT repeat domain-containing protein [Planctomycetota bacterium]
MLRLSILSVLLVAGFASGADAQDPAATPTADQILEEQSPLLVEPKTPQELFRATTLMVRLARPELARLYLEKFMAAAPDDALLLELRDKHGPATFLRLARVPELKPLSTQLLDRVNDAFRRQGADPARIDRLLADLELGPVERRAALEALRDAGPVVVPHIIGRIATAEEAAERDRLTRALVDLGPRNIPALLGVLDSPDAELKARVISVLGRLGTRDMAQYLWYSAFTQEEGYPPTVRRAARESLAEILRSEISRVEALSSYGVAAELEGIARAHFRGEYEWQPEAGGTVTVWTWDPDAGTIAARALEPAAASLYVGSRFARQALAVSEPSPDRQALYLALLLATAAHETPPGASVIGPGTAHNLALRSGPEVVAAALETSLEARRAPAAVNALVALGQIADRDSLSGDSPMIRALDDPDPGVQFAAAVAVLQLDPDRAFRAARRVVEILTRALSDSGGAAAVTVHANPQAASTVAAFLNELGYSDAPITRTGRAAFQLAATRGDVELIALNANVVHWPLSETLANLRADVRTRNIPVAIFGPEQDRPRIEYLLRSDPRLTFVASSATSDAFELQLRPFLAKFQSPALTPEQRAARAAAAAYWLGSIASGQRTQIYDLKPAEAALFTAIGDPALANNALIALGGIATNSAQQRLQEIAINRTRDDETRSVAARQLAFHIQRHGLLLSDERVLELHTARQEATSPELATAFDAVVGSLKPNPAAVERRLESHQPPPLPVAPAILP